MSDLTIQRGCKTVYEFTATESAVAVNLTGAAIYFEMRTSYPDASVITGAGATLSKSTVSGITITNGAGGIFEIAFSKADTNTLAVGVYFYGIEYIPSGETDPRSLGSGTVSITGDIVRVV